MKNSYEHGLETIVRVGDRIGMAVPEGEREAAATAAPAAEAAGGGGGD